MGPTADRLAPSQGTIFDILRRTRDDRLMNRLTHEISDTLALETPRRSDADARRHSALTRAGLAVHPRYGGQLLQGTRMPAPLPTSSDRSVIVAPRPMASSRLLHLDWALQCLLAPQLLLL